MQRSYTIKRYQLPPLFKLAQVRLKDDTKHAIRKPKNISQIIKSVAFTCSLLAIEDYNEDEREEATATTKTKDDQRNC